MLMINKVVPRLKQPHDFTSFRSTLPSIGNSIMNVSHSSRWAGFKGYISHHEVRHSPLPPGRASTPGDDGHSSPPGIFHSWSQWAGQKIKRRTADVATIEEVHLIPGWATKRPRNHTSDEHGNTFDVLLHVSGFATSRQIPELLTRSQRAFLKLARGFASIPKPQPIPLNPTDTELPLECPELLHLPPRPYEVPDDYEVETLDAHFRNTGNDDQEMDDVHVTPQLLADSVPIELARLHENLRSRLKLFWASSLPSRRIQLSVFLHPPDPTSPLHSLGPLLSKEVLTGPDGHFSGTFNIDWNGISIIPDQTHVEHELLVEARIIDAECISGFHETPTTIIHIPITHSIVRVISDIDDTVKVSRVIDGARAIFNQVFVKDLEDTVIPGMGDWYNSMRNCGVNFHYVSNCPLELFPVINQFISVSKLPRGSIRLRSYAGRSLFNGLLSSPGTRKRANVTEVLDQFPDSWFILVGDSGEQDLELYSSLAAERPSQIAGVFIRDVSAVGLEDPTGARADAVLTNPSVKPRSRGTLPFPSSGSSRVVPKRAASDTDVSPPHPGAIRIPRPTKKGSLPSTSHSLELSPDSRLLSRMSEDSSSSIASTGSSVSSSLYSMRPTRHITEGEKRRWDLQNRVNRARSVMPSHIVLRVFEDPKECVEAEQIIQRFT